MKVSGSQGNTYRVEAILRTQSMNNNPQRETDYMGKNKGDRSNQNKTFKEILDEEQAKRI